MLSHTGDVRPDVAGIFTDLPGASTTGNRPLALSLTADTRFATTPSPLKIALAVGCLVGLGVLFALLRSADRALPRVRLLPRGWWRPRPVDAVVAALLGVWWVIGSGTVDDGYIAGIVRGRGDNGFVGNVYRWLNAPEAPFGWFYEPYHWWSTISAATPWMRLPSTLLGLLCWFLVSRLLLPRLGRVGRLRGTPWVAALAFGTWWVPLDLGLRPEPWVAVGTVLAFLAVERAVATRRVLPLAAALTVAGATAAVTPGGVMAARPGARRSRPAAARAAGAHRPAPARRAAGRPAGGRARCGGRVRPAAHGRRPGGGRAGRGRAGARPDRWRAPLVRGVRALRAAPDPGRRAGRDRQAGRGARHPAGRRPASPGC